MISWLSSGSVFFVRSRSVSNLSKFWLIPVKNNNSTQSHSRSTRTFKHSECPLEAGIGRKSKFSTSSCFRYDLARSLWHGIHDPRRPSAEILFRERNTRSFEIYRLSLLYRSQANCCNYFTDNVTTPEVLHGTPGELWLTKSLTSAIYGMTVNYRNN